MKVDSVIAAKTFFIDLSFILSSSTWYWSLFILITWMQNVKKNQIAFISINLKYICYIEYSSIEYKCIMLKIIYIQYIFIFNKLFIQ